MPGTYMDAFTSEIPHLTLFFTGIKNSAFQSAYCSSVVPMCPSVHKLFDLMLMAQQGVSLPWTAGCSGGSYTV